MIHYLMLYGYGFTALLLFFLYCFHVKYNTYYYSLVRTANVLIWFYSLLILMGLLLNAYFITGLSLADKNFSRLFVGMHANWWLYIILSPPFIIVVSLLFKKVRKQAVWILLPLAGLANVELVFAFLSGNIPPPTGNVEGLSKQLPFALRFTIYGLAFLLLTIIVQYIAAYTKKKIEEEDNRLPERV